MERNSSRCIDIIFVTMACFALACIVPLPAGAQIDCSTLPQWYAQQQQQQQPQGQRVWVNQEHVFCGELNLNSKKLTGFHSRPNGVNPLNAGIIFAMVDAPNAQGLYVGSWYFEELLTPFFLGNAPKPKPLSTMFPDACTMDQVLNSIFFALVNQVQCPNNQGGSCGWSGNVPGQQYCLGNDGNPFVIKFYPRNDNANFINSAFPLITQNP